MQEVVNGLPLDDILQTNQLPQWTVTYYDSVAYKCIFILKTSIINPYNTCTICIYLEGINMQ